jgi:hypothetical protein
MYLRKTFRHDARRFFTFKHFLVKSLPLAVTSAATRSSEFDLRVEG